MAKGGLVKGNQGGIEAQVGEGREDELVFPLKTGIQVLADALMEKLRSIELPTFAMPGPSFAMAGGGGSERGGNHYHFHVGMLIADDSGIKEFERRARTIRISEAQRRGAD
jgi:hypothetical protein